MTNFDDEVLEGVVESIIFFNADTEYTVFTIKTHDSIEKISGYTSAKVGQKIKAKGIFKNTKHGNTFFANQISATYPNDVQSIEKYLRSGAVRGITPLIAKKIVAEHGDQSLDVLNQPIILERISGISPQKALEIQASWFEESRKSEIMVFLHAQKIQNNLCKKIFDFYKYRTQEVITDDPYQLAIDIDGIGFKIADEIALNMGIPKQSPQRIISAISFYLEDVCRNNGDCGIPFDNLCNTVSINIGVDHEVVEASLKEKSGYLEDDNCIFIKIQNFIYQKSLVQDEFFIANKIIEISKKEPKWIKKINLNGAIAWAEQESGMKLAEQQSQAVLMALSKNISVLTGGPGCGKTATLKVILSAIKKIGVRITLAAPTGKAAQRASEATGFPAYTIHRLLMRDESQLACDLIVIDEASMLDVELMAILLRKINPHTGILLVGDVDQLPSVGPGQVLRDIINSGVIPTTRLDEVFRQAKDSLIIRNAHHINSGEFPKYGIRSDDFQLITENNNARIKHVVDSFSGQPDENEVISIAISEEIIELITNSLPIAHGFDPVKDIQVLCPMNKGACGVESINHRLQTIFNPNPINFLHVNNIKYAVGDKIIQKKNNYDLQIFNGDMGHIMDIDHKKYEMNCFFSGREVQIPFDSLSDLGLAYAITIHKSQGSQARVVVIPLSPQHYSMLQRNLFYTGITRAKELAIVVGTSKTVRSAVKRNDSNKRTTRLKFFLESIKDNNANNL